MKAIQRKSQLEKIDHDSSFFLFHRNTWISEVQLQKKKWKIKKNWTKAKKTKKKGLKHWYKLVRLELTKVFIWKRKRSWNHLCCSTFSETLLIKKTRPWSIWFSYWQHFFWLPKRKRIKKWIFLQKHTAKAYCKNKGPFSLQVTVNCQESGFAVVKKYFSLRD